MSGVNEAHWFISDRQRVRSLRALFSAYYAEIKTDIVFDTNRRWCANMSLVLDMFPDAWVLCCVRHPIAVIDSIERLLQTHPLTLSTIIGLEPGTNVFGRVKRLMEPGGMVGYSLNAVQEAYYGLHRDRLLMVNYDNLAQFPDRTMAEIHEKLELPAFEYTFDAIEPIPGAALFDQSIGTPGLHSLKKRVEYLPRQSLLPPVILNSLPVPFWL
jgi:sulfotransferase